MIGPKGCGKTSILSVMLNDVQQFIEALVKNRHNFGAKATLPSFAAKSKRAQERMTGCYETLKSIADLAKASKGHPIDLTAASLRGDAKASDYTMKFSIGKSQVALEFWDFPGGFFSRREEDFKATDAQRKEWEELLVSADVLLVAIDAPAQLSGVDFGWGFDSRYYDRITDIIKRSVKRSKTSVVIVPVKCEHLALESECDTSKSRKKIVQRFSVDGCEELYLRIRQRLGELVRFLTDDKNARSVDAYFIPMITVGGIKSNGQRSENGRTVEFVPVVPEFYKLTPFAPKNCEKLLALCLLQVYAPLVRYWNVNRSLWEKGWRATAKRSGRVLSWLGRKLRVSRVKKLSEKVDRIADSTPFEAFFSEMVKCFRMDEMLKTSIKDGAFSGLSKDVSSECFDGCACLNEVVWPEIK